VAVADAKAAVKEARAAVKEARAAVTEARAAVTEARAAVAEARAYLECGDLSPLWSPATCRRRPRQIQSRFYEGGIPD